MPMSTRRSVLLTLFLATLQVVQVLVRKSSTLFVATVGLDEVSWLQHYTASGALGNGYAVMPSTAMSIFSEKSRHI